MPALLEVNNLRTYFRSRQGLSKAVDGLSFRLQPGEILGIVGESGSGKSVTALSLMRLISPPGAIVGGEIRFEGRDILQLSPEAMRQLRGQRMAMIFQEPATSMNPVLPVGFQIVEAIQSHQRVAKKAARQRALELMQSVGIPDAARRIGHYPHQFSGGMLQRLMIAMGLALSPALLIADEPVTALDVTIQAQILDLLHSLRQQSHTAIVLISHDMGVIAEVCDRVLVMYLGKVVEDAPVEALFDNPQHPYTQGLLASIPSLDPEQRQLVAIPGTIPSPLDAPKGCLFSNRCPQVMARCHQQRPALRSATEHTGHVSHTDHTDQDQEQATVPYHARHQVACFLHHEASEDDLLSASAYPASGASHG